MQQERPDACDVIVGVVLHGGGQLAAEQVRLMHAEPGHDQGIEALDAHIAAIGAQDPVRLFAELPVAGTVLQFHDQRSAAVDHRKDLREEGDTLFRAAKPQRRQFFIGEGVHAGIHAADAVERIVVKHNDLAVFGKLNVQFDAVAGLGRQTKRGQ